MATVYVSVGQVGVPGPGGAPVFRGSCRSETITSSGTSASGSLTGTTGDVAKVFCDTAVYANAGAAASASAGVYVAAGVAEYIGLQHGQTINVIDV